MRKVMVLLLVFGLFGVTQVANAQWYARGDFNTWDTSTPMLDDGAGSDTVASDGIFTATGVIPTLGAYPGYQEWKAADATWSTSYPPQNSRIWMAESAVYTLYFDTNTYTDGWVPASNFVYFSPLAPVADGPYTVTGDFNGGTWDPASAANHMKKRGDGKFYLDKVIATAGTWAYKVAFNDNWTIQIGVNGWEDNATAMNFTTTSNNQTVRFLVDPAKGRLKVITDMTVKINEAVIDDYSTDNEEFIELYGPGGKDLTGWTLEGVNGTDGSVYRTINLTSIPADGYLVISGQAGCPNVDLVVTPATDLIQNGPEDALRLKNADGDVVDAFGYEIKSTPTYLLAGIDYEGPGMKADVNNEGFDPTDYSVGRAIDGYDTDNNATDFCFAPNTPGLPNQTPHGLLPNFVEQFDDAVDTTYGSEFWGFYTDPTAVAPGTAGCPSVASPQGGNFGRFSDPTGGGDCSVFMDRPTTDCFLDAYVYLNDNLALSGESVYSSIILRGYQDNVQNNPSGTYNGQTGVIIEIHRHDTYSVLRVVERISNVIQNTICEVSLPGSEYSGWRRVRVDLVGSTVVATIGGTVGNLTDGEKFVGTTDLVAGGVGFAYREYTSTNDDWLCIDDLNIGVTPNTALPPAAPTDLAVSSVATDSIGVTWTDNATTETGYYTFAAHGRLQWTPTASLPADSTSWTTNTLSPNTAYTIKVGVYDANGMTRTGPLTTYTLALTPVAPVVGNADVHTLDVTIGADGNPAGTEYAIYEATTSQWVQSDGTLGATPVWADAATWGGTVIVNGLEPDTAFSFQVTARNGALIETAASPAAGATTLPATRVRDWKMM